MRKTNNRKYLTLTALFAFLVTFTPALLSLSASHVYAATTPSLGTAASFGILSSTFTRNVGVTAITGDLGYTTLSGSGSHTVTGSTHVADGTYSTAGTDQGTALTALAAQTCDFSFGSPTDLSLESQPLAPGVYCITAAASIGTGGITLSGAGTYIFRITGAFTTVANSDVTLTGGASACDVFWTPTEATTLGANTTFVGTVIDDSGISVGSTTSWTGRALAFGETVTTDTDTIAVPTCPEPTPTPTPTPTSVALSSSSSSSSVGSSSSCPPIPVSIVAPNIIEARRVDADSIFISWGPFSGTDKFNVQFGSTSDNWLYNVDATGFSTTINALPLNQPIWVRVAARNDCDIGEYGTAFLVGGTSSTSSSTLIPGLPNTGIGPDSNHKELQVFAVIALSLITPFLTFRAVKLMTQR